MIVVLLVGIVIGYCLRRAMVPEHSTSTTTIYHYHGAAVPPADDEPVWLARARKN